MIGLTIQLFYIRPLFPNKNIRNVTFENCFLKLPQFFVRYVAYIFRTEIEKQLIHVQAEIPGLRFYLAFNCFRSKTPYLDVF